MKKKVLNFTAKILISAVFIIWLIYKINWSEAVSYLEKIEWWKIVLYILVILLSLFISAKKWQRLAVFKGFHGSLMNFFKLYLTGTFINNFVPSTIGGDIFRAYQIGKTDGRYSEATSTVVMDRFSGLLALMLMALFFSLLNINSVLKNYPLMITNLLIILALLATFFIIKVRRADWMKKIINFFPEKIVIFLKNLNSFEKDQKIIYISLAYSVIFNLIGVGVANFILFWSLNININILDYLSVIFIISILSSIPAGVGLKEWAYVTFFGFFGINISAVFIVAILNRFLQGLVNVAALPIYLKSKK
jgi:glycosyltransferase 2 family protein